ncbi:MAG TPA: histone deacetylase [Longimicrobiales bacterium]|nr:histone deacetylase [Longimicrobiales bacterium]
MPAPTGFFLHPASPLHDTGWGHVEHQGRLRALAAAVGRDLLTLHGHVEQMRHGDADVADLLRVHTPEHVARVREACRIAEGRGKIVSLDPDTRVSAASWEAAVGSAGTVIAAAAAVAEGRAGTAFVAARPPGHHATPDRAMGFCLFNSVAVAARWLQAAGHAERVLIVDWDVHHGNGTQEIFYEDPSVFFLSLHQWPHYPGTGAADERGQGAGEGTTLNAPLPAGTSAADYRARFERALEEATRRFRPDFVLVSSGFDSMAGDPLGGLLLEPADLYAMTRTLVEGPAAVCGGRVVAVLEGGYAPERVGAGTVAVIRALADLPPEDPGPS